MTDAEPTSRPAPRWRVGGGRTLVLDRPIVMGVLNATPDSFSDGGVHLDPGAAIDAGRRMLLEGAAILDVGGESTRPGAERVDAAEQIRRTVPVLEGLAAAVRDAGAALSIDTTRAAVVEAALAAGATIVNDVSGGTEDADLLGAVAASDAGVVLMHRLRPPDADAFSDRYRGDTPVYPGGVVTAVGAALRERHDAASAAGIDAERVLLDPGLGFGKTVEQNLALAAAMPRLADLGGRPLLGAGSRKSFLGAVSGARDPAERDPETIALAAVLAAGGVMVHRVHAVGPHVRALAVAHALAGAAGGDPE